MKEDTLIAHAGRHPEDNHGIVNPPVYHASTVLFPTLAALEAAAAAPYEGVRYGRYGTPTTYSFEEAFAAVEGADRAMVNSSGLAAITIAMLPFLEAGDHLLVTDSTYSRPDASATPSSSASASRPPITTRTWAPISRP